MVFCACSRTALEMSRRIFTSKVVNCGPVDLVPVVLRSRNNRDYDLFVVNLVISANKTICSFLIWLLISFLTPKSLCVIS